MRLVIGAVLVLFVRLGLLAQPAPLFDHITTTDGLPGNEVFSVFEDRLGYMWAGTRTGLARLEGTRIRLFHHDHNDSTSIAHDHANSFAEDADGRLWIATMAGLSRFDERRGTFTSYRVSAKGNAAHQANRMLQVLCVGDSLIWVVSEHGLFRFDQRTNTFLQVDGSATGLGPPGRISARCALIWDPVRRGIWAGSSKGLTFWEAATDRWTDHRNAPAGNTLFTAHNTSTPALQGQDTLWCYDAETFSMRVHDLRKGTLAGTEDLGAALHPFTMQWIEADPDGSVWISTWTHRLFRRDRKGGWREQVASSTAPAALRSSHVTTSLRTRSGERWFGTDEGIAILRPSGYATQVVTLVGNTHAVSELVPLGGDTLLVGTQGDGIYAIDLGNGVVEHARVTMVAAREEDVAWANSVHSISRQANGRIGVATGMLPAELRFSPLRLVQDKVVSSGIPGSVGTHFTFISPGKDHELWAGTWQSGLFHLDLTTGASTRIDTVEGAFGKLPSRMMLCWLNDSKGRSWLGMNDGGGLACLESGRFRSVHDASGGNLGAVVRCLAEAPDGTLWLGTHENGIVVYDPESASIRYLTRKDGLPGVLIYRLLFDRAGAVWASTAQGLSRMPAGATGFQPFSLPDGMDPNSVTGALAQLKDGRIGFGVGRHVVLYDGARDDRTGEVPRATITSHRINDDLYFNEPPEEALRLPADRKAITLELGALGLPPRTAPLFRYRLSEEQVRWIEIGAAQRIDLFDLPTGTHRIEVQASANGVDWSATPAVVDLVVLPPFWSTWWFRIGAVLLVLSSFFTGFRLYLRERLRKERTRFEREQAVLTERVRIASDMHDDLGAGLSALKLRSEMALRVEKDPLKREQLGSLANTAGDLIGSMRQIIWTMNQDQATVEDLVVYTSNYVRTYCAQNELQLEVAIEGPWPAILLSTEQRRNMFLVVKEAMHNTVKHAQATTVRLDMRWSDGFLVELGDNGIGLPKGTEDAVGNGLRNMRKRIASLGGTLSMNGDSGAKMRFHVPIDLHP